MPRGDPHVTIGLRLHPDIITELDKWAEGRNLSRSDALKALLRYAWARRDAVALAQGLGLEKMPAERSAQRRASYQKPDKPKG